MSQVCLPLFSVPPSPSTEDSDFQQRPHLHSASLFQLLLTKFWKAQNRFFIKSLEYVANNGAKDSLFPAANSSRDPSVYRVWSRSSYSAPSSVGLQVPGCSPPNMGVSEPAGFAPKGPPGVVETVRLKAPTGFPSSLLSQVLLLSCTTSIYALGDPTDTQKLIVATHKP